MKDCSPSEDIRIIQVWTTISWRSTKQTLVAISTMEAEFVSCFEATTHGVWLKSFIYGLRIMDSIFRPMKIFCDNSVAVMAKWKSNKYLAIREKVVVIKHISTELIIVDPLTKGMPSLNSRIM
ncbi:hypothetical protein P8452_62754 [Trifolium repens]|nr:hypothetical protein P8452_62754 [Trifolium repens]